MKSSRHEPLLDTPFPADLLYALFPAIPDHFFILDQKYRICFSNWNRTEHLSEELKYFGVTCHKLFQGRDTPCSRCSAREAFATCKPVYREMSQRRDLTTVRVSIHPVPGQQGPPRYLLIHVTDITEARRTDRKLRQQERFLQTILDNLDNPVWIKDRDYRYLVTNSSFSSLFGLKPDQIIGRKSEALHPESSFTGEDSTDRKALEQGIAARLEQPVTDINKTRHFFEIRKIPVHDDQGQVIGVAGIARDISDRKKMNQRHEQQTKQIQENEVLLRENLQAQEETLEQRLAEGLLHGVLPYLIKLQQTELEPMARLFVETAMANVKQILSSHGAELSTGLLRLTPMELKIAELVREGMQTKEIAARLGLSPATVNTHRRNIRKRLGLNKKSTNLHSFLNSISPI
ncbi:PAS domain-containing protein [Desulfolithobacter sp.]